MVQNRRINSGPKTEPPTATVLTRERRANVDSPASTSARKWDGASEMFVTWQASRRTAKRVMSATVSAGTITSGAPPRSGWKIRLMDKLTLNGPLNA